MLFNKKTTKKKSAGKKYLFPYMQDFAGSMIKVLSLSTQDSPTLVDYNLKKEILKVSLYPVFGLKLS